MKSDTPIFNRSVCCICTKSICIKTSLYGWIVALNILMAFVGGVLILVGLVGNGTTEQLIVGIILHSFSLAIELLLSTYPSRYLLDMYGDNIQKTCCQKACCTFSEYSAKSYFLWGLYFILIIAASACCTSDNIEVTNRAFIAILIFFGSFTAVTYWSMVMTPTCAPTSEDLFYSEDRLTGFDASFNLGFMFLLSFVVTNVGFGVYFADEILHYVLISTGSASMIVSAGL
ncbi:MAG TPA: hypothetical protein PKD85_22220, partial [Saprospiraceae bacterium]|nr:hypothetical protein [Saprospiraceae bacterium]